MHFHFHRLTLLLCNLYPLPCYLCSPLNFVNFMHLFRLFSRLLLFFAQSVGNERNRIFLLNHKLIFVLFDIYVGFSLSITFRLFCNFFLLHFSISIRLLYSSLLQLLFCLLLIVQLTRYCRVEQLQFWSIHRTDFIWHSWPNFVASFSTFFGFFFCRFF